MTPPLGSTVIYRSRTGTYDCPAVVACNITSLNKDNVAAGRMYDLDSDDHVHLVVFSAGPPDAEPVLLQDGHPDHPLSRNQGGTYQEWNISYDPKAGAGTWRYTLEVDTDQPPPGTVDGMTPIYRGRVSNKVHLAQQLSDGRWAMFCDATKDNGSKSQVEVERWREKVDCNQCKKRLHNLRLKESEQA